MPRTIQLYSPWAWSFNWPEGDPRHLKVGRWVPDDCFHHYRSYLQVGDLHVVHVSAPGIGHRSYRITAIDETGIYGALVEDTVRILTPGEVI